MPQSRDRDDRGTGVPPLAAAVGKMMIGAPWRHAADAPVRTTMMIGALRGVKAPAAVAQAGMMTTAARHADKVTADGLAMPKAIQKRHGRAGRTGAN